MSSLPHLCVLLASCSACLAGSADSGGSGPLLLRPSTCASRFEQVAPAVLARRGLGSASVYFPEGEAAWQELQYPGSLCPDQALHRALDFLLSSRDRESLPSLSEEIDPSCDARCFVNRASSLVGMVADERSQLANRLLPAPPRGGTVASSWVFFVSVPDLSQHGFWALVARDGSEVQLVAEN